jgi:hypothetical protein
MMPAPLTALEQRLFERLEAAMMDSDLGFPAGQGRRGAATQVLC